MANIEASKKNIKRIAIQTDRNRRIKSILKTLTKKVDVALQANDKDAAKAAAIRLTAALDKAAKRDVIHRNKAARHKSSIAKYIFAS